MRRLSSRVVISNALDELLADSVFWAFYIERSELDWDSGTKQDPHLIIRKGDPVELGASLDVRLVKSKWVRLLVTWLDGGTVVLDLTSRTWSAPVPSDGATNKMKKFFRSIAKGSGSRMLTPEFSLLLLVWPVVIGLFVLVLSLLAGGTYRHQLVSGDPNTIAPPWVSAIMRLALYSWPLAILAALCIFLLCLRSGGLRVKSEYSVKFSLLKFARMIRRESLHIGNVDKIMVAVFLALAGGLISKVIGWVFS